MVGAVGVTDAADDDDDDDDDDDVEAGRQAGWAGGGGYHMPVPRSNLDHIPIQQSVRSISSSVMAFAIQMRSPHPLNNPLSRSAGHNAPHHGRGDQQDTRAHRRRRCCGLSGRGSQGRRGREAQGGGQGQAEGCRCDQGAGGAGRGASCSPGGWVCVHVRVCVRVCVCFYILRGYSRNA